MPPSTGVTLRLLTCTLRVESKFWNCSCGSRRTRSRRTGIGRSQLRKAAGDCQDHRSGIQCKLWPRSTLCDSDPISCPILTTILVAIIPRYRDARYWYPILTPIQEYHVLVTDIGTPDIDPNIDPDSDIGYMVYDIGDMMTRYRISKSTYYYLLLSCYGIFYTNYLTIIFLLN